MTQDLHWTTPLSDEEPVLRTLVAEPADDDPGAAWHLCGIGVKDQR